MTRCFCDETREALRAQGWRLADAAAGVGEIAYRPGLMPGSPGLAREECQALLPALDRRLPPRAHAAMGAAATYEWLLDDHHARTGEWLLTRCFTWTGDTDDRGYPVAVGAFGGPRPILKSALPEGRGRGVGLLPLILPV